MFAFNASHQWMERSESRRGFLFMLSLLAGLFAPTLSLAGVVWSHPTTPAYEFFSIGRHTICFPNVNGFCGQFVGQGQTTAASDLQGSAKPDPPPNGLDTLNAELINADLRGAFGPYSAETKIGVGNTFFPGGVGLVPSGGQIQDKAGSPNGTIQFPANSVFDVFFDVWVDLNGDGKVELGEVFSNDVLLANGSPDSRSDALTMFNGDLQRIPPQPAFRYDAIGIVSINDPWLYTFQHTVLPLPLELYAINPNRTIIDPTCTAGPIPNAPVCAQLTAAVHVPEPASLALLALGLAGLGFSRRKQ